MQAEEIARQLSEGTVLEGPHFGEPVRVLLAKARGGRVEIVAEGVNTKQTWKKLLKVEEFESAVTIKSSGGMATLTGDARQFRLATEAHRIRLAYQYDPHFAVSVSQVDPLPHQLDAVYNRLLTQPSIRYLIADDPGAGKTIMAGLLIKELKFRGLAEHILIVTPANLTDQWRREMHDKFGETFAVINRATVDAAYGRNVWEETAQVICSIDFVARNDEIRERMRDTHWDLVVVDEAHKMAAYRYGTKTKTTGRYEPGFLGRTVPGLSLSTFSLRTPDTGILYGSDLDRSDASPSGGSDSLMYGLVLRLTECLVRDAVVKAGLTKRATGRTSTKT